MSFLSKTFGGLSKAYYVRNILFGTFFCLLAMFMGYLIYVRSDSISALLALSTYGVINLFLYPYSRFVYESVMGYILGNNTFYVNSSTFLNAKLITMGLCFFLAIFIAPIGLIYLYFYHTKQEKNNNSQN